ncbi:hypothetical protein [Loigolactobacillus zhaoyuanensis]|uniref:Uncharacterized protein n=1 Tax=Loigolactobacillus zhaoyuanensis TaxID=2486017 RepID=A0ABW8U8B8_9LACO
MADKSVVLDHIVITKQGSSIKLGIDLHGEKINTIAYDGTLLSKYFAPKKTIHIDRDEFNVFYHSLLELCMLTWKNFTPKEENSFGSDYSETYEKKFDNNYYFDVGEDADDGTFKIFIDGFPDGGFGSIRFNKIKSQALVYDVAQLLGVKS